MNLMSTHYADTWILYKLVCPKVGSKDPLQDEWLRAKANPKVGSKDPLQDEWLKANLKVGSKDPLQDEWLRA